MKKQRMNSHKTHAQARLTIAERQVLEMLLYTGYSLKEIASQRHSSYNTVRTQCESIYKKLRVHSRPELVAKLRGREGSSSSSS